MNQSISRRLPAPRSNDDYLDVGAALATVWQSKKLVLGIAAVTFAVGCAYALLAPPVYQANILIKVDITDPTQKAIPANLSGIFDLKTASSAELEMLRSRAVVTRAVENARLYIDAKPKYLPLVGQWLARRSKQLSTPGSLAAAGYVWGAESIDIKTLNVPESLEAKSFTLKIGDAGAYSLQYKGEVEINGKVGVDAKAVTPDGEILINVAAVKANPGAEFIVRRYSKEDAVEELQKDLVIAERGKQSGIISVSLEDSEPAVAAKVLNEIAQQYIQQNVALKSEEAERSLAFLETQLPDLKVAIETSEAKYNAFRNSRGTVDLGEEVKSVLQQSVQSQLRLVELRQRRDELLTRFQNENPLVEAVNQQIRTVNGELGSINDKIRKIPGTEQDVVRLTRDVRVNTELYSSLLNTANQLRLVKASQVGSAKLIDSAVQPATPVGPKRKLIVSAAAAIGLFLGLLAAFVRKAFTVGIDSHQELLEQIGTPVSVVVPHSNRQLKLSAQVLGKHRRASVLSEEATEEGSVESLRTFRTALAYSQLSARNNVIAIVGPTSGVGKSFVSANLAALLASSGKRILLIDADLRGGYLHRYFGLERRIGLSELIASEIQIAQSITANVVKNLDFMSTGMLRERPADSLANGVLGDILKNVSATYDLVVIDNAPVLAVADSLIVSNYAGLIFCVVRRGKTSIEQILETEKRFEQSGNPVSGLIFNDAKRGTVSYGSGYRRLAPHTGHTALRRN